MVEPCASESDDNAKSKQYHCLIKTVNYDRPDECRPEKDCLW